MALGGVFLLDLLLRARDLQMFYGDQGVLPRALFLGQSWLLSEYQPFLATGSTWGLSLFFLIGMVAASSLIIGYRARYAAVACWLFTVAIQLRNPVVLDGGDELLRLLLFWCPFLPISARWSMDARIHPEWTSLPNNYRSVATAGLYLQYIVLYFFAAHLKTGAAWRETGDAVYYALSIDQFSTHFGKALLKHPGLLEAATPVVLGVEYALAALLLIPAKWKWPRYAFLTLAVLFHLGLALSLHFGIFMLIVICGLTAFLPQQLFKDRAGEGEPTSLPPGFQLSIATKLFCGFILFYVLVVNLQSIRHRHRLPGWTMVVARVTYQHQHWHLFAPEPFRDDGWFVFEVTTDSGLTYELSSLEKPDHVSTTFPNQRWRRWFQNLVQEPFQDTQSWRDSTAFYLAKRWIQNNPNKRLKSYRLLFMEEMTPPPGEEPKVEMKVLSESVKSGE